MRHRKAGLKLSRTASHRDAMFRNMVTSLFKHQRIRTTDAKAKELRRWADHIVTLAKRGDLHARRLALAIVREKNVVHKLFEEAESRFSAVAGGYTRVIKIGRRAGDAAAVSIVELVAPAIDGGKTKKKTDKVKATVPADKTVSDKTTAAEREAGTRTAPAPAEEKAGGEVDPDESIAARPDEEADPQAVTETDEAENAAETPGAAPPIVDTQPDADKK